MASMCYIQRKPCPYLQGLYWGLKWDKVFTYRFLTCEVNLERTISDGKGSAIVQRKDEKII